MDLTHSLSIAPTLLAPATFYSATAIAADPKLVPDEPGIYGWWFDDATLNVPDQDSIAVGSRRLLYLGIAPSAPSRSGAASKRTLRDRLKNHTRGPIATSTLRRTLTSLLGGQLGFGVVRLPSGKLAMSRDDEQRLTGWMTDHARVAWMVHPRPWEIESALIVGGPRLPLNIRESADPFRAELQAMRRRLGLQ
ncbi:GIY-YIG nuclease family protein [Devosia sp.]|uniref:GIY-YIG nuclease family protein n=1 Tax=Devosia sp. TaxID=1871048 RepID=UPI0035B1A48C